MFFSLTSFQSKEDVINDDYVIIDLLTQKKENLNLCLDSSNNNKYVISIIEEWKLAKKNGEKKLNEFYQTNGISDITKFKSIFNSKEITNLVSQKENLEWKIPNKNTKKLILCNKLNNKSDSSEKRIFISKPIYTIDRSFAIINIVKGKNSHIEVYKKSGENWSYYSSFAFILF